jgi:hypothetical protein
MSEAKNHITVYLSDTDKERLERNTKRNKSSYISTGINVLDYHKVMIFSVRNVVNNRVYLGLDKPETYFKECVIDRLPSKFKGIEHDILEFGKGAFEKRSLGLFQNINEASYYLDFLINKYFDEGIVLYNDELFTGYTQKTINVPIKFNDFMDLIKICNLKKASFSQLTQKLIEKLIKTLNNQNNEKRNDP